MWRIVERNAQQVRGYRLSFRAAAEGQSEKHAAGSTDLRGRFLVGGGNDTNVDSRRSVTAYCLKLTLLKNAEQLRLKLQWHVSNFVEKESATIRQRESAAMRIDSAGKGSPFVSEKLAFAKAGTPGRTAS